MGPNTLGVQDSFSGFTSSFMLADPGVDGVVCIATAPFLPDHSFLDASSVILETAAAFPEKPVAVWLYGPNQPAFNEKFNRGGKILRVIL